MSQNNKKHKLSFQDSLIGLVIVYVFAAAMLSIFVWQLIRYDLYREWYIYLGILMAIGWFIFIFGWVYLLLRFLPRWIAEYIALGTMLILIGPVGIIGAIRLTTNLGHPGSIGLLIYFLIPFLLGSIVLVLLSIKSRWN